MIVCLFGERSSLTNAVSVIAGEVVARLAAAGETSVPVGADLVTVVTALSTLINIYTHNITTNHEYDTLL